MARLDLKTSSARFAAPTGPIAPAALSVGVAASGQRAAGKPIVIDGFLPAEAHQAVWAYLNTGQWDFGAFSDRHGDRYHYRHFAGIRQNGEEPRDPQAFGGELDAHPELAAVWRRLADGPLSGHRLARCYANAMGPGVEGGVHQDSNIADHMTAIYYPHLQWAPALAGETLLFNDDATEIVQAIYPRPNRLLIFPGTMPHVARPMSKRAKFPARITLMFKTLGA